MQRPEHWRAVAVLLAVIVASWPSPASGSFPGRNGRLATTVWVGFPEIGERCLGTVMVWPMGRTSRQATPCHELAFSPDGAKIVYSGVVANIDFGAARTVVDEAFDSVWSPDGRRIAFMRPDGIRGQVCVARVATGATRCLGPGQDVAWSARGVLAVLGWRDWAQQSAVFVMRPDGSRVRQLKVGGRRWFAGHAGGLDWSPDGRNLAFVRGLGADPDQSGINVLNVRTGKTRRLWQGVNPLSPVFSPDATRVGYVENAGERRGPGRRVLRVEAAVYTIELSGSGRRAIVHPRRFDGQSFLSLSWQALPRGR